MQYTDLPTIPGAVLYTRPDGRQVRLIAGGSGEGEQGQGDGQQNPQGQTGQQDPPAQQQGGQQSTFQGQYDPERAERLITNLRNDNSALKEKFTSQDKVLRALAEKAGIDVDGKPDPDKLLADISSRDERLKKTRIENAVLKVAPKHGADLDALLDSRTFLSELAELDPADKTFQANVEKAIKSAVEKNPRLKAQQGQTTTQTQQQAPAAPSGGDFNGSPQGQRQWTEADVDRASAAELDKAMKDGLLRDYMNA
jgi:hypothetical protein